MQALSLSLECSGWFDAQLSGCRPEALLDLLLHQHSQVSGMGRGDWVISVVNILASNIAGTIQFFSAQPERPQPPPGSCKEKTL